MDHGTFRELAAGAALDDLDPLERAALDAHLGACPPCRKVARELVDSAGMLAFAAPRRTPPAALLGGILAAVAASEGRPVNLPAADLGSAPAIATPIRLPLAPGATAARAAAFAPVPVQVAATADPGDTSGVILELDALRRDRTRYRRLSFAGLAAAAVLAIAVGALGASATGLRSDLDAATLQRDAAVAQLATSDAAMTVALAPGHATATMKPEPMAGKATVYVVYMPGTPDAWMMAGNLPATPAGEVYQLWLADSSGVHPVTTFTCDGSSPCLAPYSADLASADATMITLEPVGGATGEPGPQVAFGTLDG
jgi:predicted anti-sigma-YlaC factor YlaD